MSGFVDHDVTIDLNFAEMEALLKTIGIAITNLLSKQGRVSKQSSMYSNANDEMLVLVGIQQKLMEVLVECSSPS